MGNLGTADEGNWRMDLETDLLEGIGSAFADGDSPVDLRYDFGEWALRLEVETRHGHHIPIP